VHFPSWIDGRKNWLGMDGGKRSYRFGGYGRPACLFFLLLLFLQNTHLSIWNAISERPEAKELGILSSSKQAGKHLAGIINLDIRTGLI
jgi:hypothetical protein